MKEASKDPIPSIDPAPSSVKDSSKSFKANEASRMLDPCSYHTYPYIEGKIRNRRLIN